MVTGDCGRRDCRFCVPVDDGFMQGEFTPFMVIGYFGLTTFLTAFAFGSYLVLTKLKII